ncbi:MAG: hypothetical protein AAGA92_10390 [Planctomycetota bacterium]
MDRRFLAISLSLTLGFACEAAAVKIYFEGQSSSSYFDRVSGHFCFEIPPELAYWIRSDWVNTTTQTNGFLALELAASSLISFELELELADSLASMTLSDTSGMAAVTRLYGSPTYANEYQGNNTHFSIEVGDYAIDLGKESRSGEPWKLWDIVTWAELTIDYTTDGQTPFESLLPPDADLLRDATISLRHAAPTRTTLNYTTLGPSGALIDYEFWEWSSVELTQFLVVPEPSTWCAAVTYLMLLARRSRVRRA